MSERVSKDTFDAAKFVVWWLSDEERRWLMEQPERSFGWPGYDADISPRYIRKQVRESYGRAARGRMRVDDKICGNFPGLPGLPAAFNTSSSAGFLMRRSEIGEVSTRIGVVTDCDGNVLTEYSEWKPDTRFPAGKPRHD